MRHIAVVLLAALVAVPAPGLERRGGRRSTPLFELLYGGPAPTLWGAGHLSGGRGETVTTTRATVSTCQTSSSGGTTLGVNQPCVKPSGVRSSNTHSNTWQHSEAITTAPWAEEQLGGVALPVETLDQATGPFGSATADRVDFPATAAGQSSIRYNTNALALAANQSTACWVRGVSGVSDTGTLDFCNHVGGAYTCQNCNFTSADWIQCSRINFTATNSPTLIGNATFYNGGTARPAQSVYITACQAQTSGGVVLHPYCPTAGATATCNVDAVSATPSALPSTASGWSYAVTITPVAIVNSAVWAGTGGVALDASNRTQTYLINANTVACSHLSTGAPITATVSGAVMTAGTPIRAACSFNANSKTLTAYYNGKAGTPVTNAAATNFTPTSFAVAGLPLVSVHADGAAIHSVCYASNPDGCR